MFSFASSLKSCNEFLIFRIRCGTSFVSDYFTGSFLFYFIFCNTIIKQLSNANTSKKFLYLILFQDSFNFIYFYLFNSVFKCNFICYNCNITAFMFACFLQSVVRNYPPPPKKKKKKKLGAEGVIIGRMANLSKF